ncbi:hypothetical protein [Nostoc sp. CHAB 5715]|uniref:hypothetical protein n=1 Tax=Nostoc sp. CHAB 5715 TaxID=2780400 RepID=UPI001E51CB23|nr:hypothetical protein [Nostoc sp. CHAB 5715]MCC5624376.1 hypothetical protein [Nostoc sp. CHAB 5715]
MAFYTYNGTPGADYLTDYNHSSFAQYPYIEFNTVYINGFGGDDYLSGLDLFSFYNINGGAGNDIVFGTYNPDVLAGDDPFDVVGGNDFLAGFGDNDALLGFGGNDTLIGGWD